MRVLVLAVMAAEAVVARDSLASAPLTVEPEVPVTAVDVSLERANNSPSLAVDPTDPGFVVLASRIDGPRFDCLLHVSGDGGRSWLPSRPVPTLPAGADTCYAPEVAFDRNGVLYYLFVGLKRPGNTPMGAFLTTSTDRRTFTAPRQLLGPDRYMVRMAIDPDVGEGGRLHLVWLEANSPPPLGGLPPPPNPILAAHSDDGGRTLSAPVQVSDPQRRRVVAPALTIGGGGAVHVAYYDLEEDARDYQGLEGPRWEGTWSLVVSTSTDKGRRFSRHVLAAPGLVPPERVMLIFTMPPPSLVADASNRLWASWSDARNGDWDVFLTRSSDGGRSWSAASRVNDDEVGNGRHQYLPRLSLATGGRLDAIFYDRRDDAENARNHVYFTYSSDGGRRFAANRRLTSEASHASTGARYAIPSAVGLVEFGSRLAVLSQGSSAVTGWTDTRNVPRGNTQQDVFATEVRFPESPSLDGPFIPRFAFPAFAMLVVGVLAVVFARRRTRRRRLPEMRAVGASRTGGEGVSARRQRTHRFSRAPSRRVAVAALVASSVALLVGTLLSSFGDGAGVRRAGTPRARPPSVPVVNAAMSEYRFEHGAILTQGRVVLRARNAGQVDHALTLVRLPDDLTVSLGEMLQSGTRRAVPTTARLLRRPPGSVGVFAVDLHPGRYALFCFLADADGVSHVDKGMASEFEVR